MLFRKPKILVAPLDWGLGHASRCIPIIKELKTQGCEVWAASAGAQKSLLAASFPDLRFFDLAGWSVKLGKTPVSTWLAIAGQFPKIQAAIRRENRWLEEFVRQEKPDAVISDNRYGLHHPTIPSVLITHQLSIRSGLGSLIDRQAERMIRRQIKSFSCCWVPDLPGESSLAGALSRTTDENIPVRYVGALSRFTKDPKAKTDIDLLAMISGPEPQRRLFEEKILEGLKQFRGRAVVLRGLPGEGVEAATPPGVSLFNHLEDDRLNDLLNRAAVVVSRSGYTTVMELASLQKKMVLVPTPGQGEQEYLARYLRKKKLALKMNQKDFHLAAAVQEAMRFDYRFVDPADREQLSRAVRELLDEIQGRSVC